MRISACIIACDEAEYLPACLDSVAFCDEIVVVDSGSTDATVAIAQAAGAIVVEQPWLGFAAQRNVALDRAGGEWVLEIDADERISAPLRAEIERFLRDPPTEVDLCGLPLRDIFLGRALGPSAKYPKYRHRLLRRGAHRHDEARTVHEGIVAHGVVHPFSGDLMHLLAESWGEAIGDTWRYARLEAAQIHTRSTLAGFVKGAILRPTIKFAYRIVVDGGWRDGWRGLVKVTLDCLTDTIVWTRHLLGRRGGEQGHSGVQGGEHYGSWKFRSGNLRVAAVAAGPRDAERAAAWLTDARAAGADVVLIAGRPASQFDAAGALSHVRVRTLERAGAIALIRALDAEEQLRPLDAVVTFGSRAGLLLRAVPPALRGSMGHVTHSSDPRTIAWDVREPAQTASS